MLKPAERRRNPRLRREERAFIRPLYHEDNVDEPLRCTTVDVSLTGLQVLVNDKLQPGELMDILIYMEGYGDGFHLLGEAKWCAPARSKDTYYMGVEIKNTDDENFASWRHVFN